MMAVQFTCSTTRPKQGRLQIATTPCLLCSRLIQGSAIIHNHHPKPKLTEQTRDNNTANSIIKHSHTKNTSNKSNRNVFPSFPVWLQHSLNQKHTRSTTQAFTLNELLPTIHRPKSSHLIPPQSQPAPRSSGRA